MEGEEAEKFSAEEVSMEHSGHSSRAPWPNLTYPYI